MFISKKNVPKKKTVLIVEAILKDSRGKVLVLKRSKKNRHYKGKWQLPGGKVEKNESPLEAIKREIKEETNCNITSIKPLKKLVFSEQTKRKSAIVKLVIYTGRINGEICLCNDHTEYKFVKPTAQIKKLLAPISRRVLYN